jgi:hypothetical protein
MQEMLWVSEMPKELEGTQHCLILFSRLLKYFQAQCFKTFRKKLERWSFSSLSS